MMNLKILDAGGQLRKNIATISKVGLIGFNGKVSELLRLNKNQHYNFAIDEEAEGGREGDVIVLIKRPARTNTTTKLYQVGNYFYLRAHQNLDLLGIDYYTNNIIYSVEKGEEYEGCPTVVLKIKEVTKRTPY